jgi:DnaJ-class molecular chaperone
LLDDISREEKKAKRRDFYKILGIRRDSSQEEIRKAYRKLASQWHPDKNRETEEMREHAEMMFKDINESYNILSDLKKKKIYDEGGHPDDPNSAFHMNHQDKESFDNVFNSFFENEKKQSDFKESKNVNKDYNNSHYKDKDSFHHKKRHRDDNYDKKDSSNKHRNKY